MGSASVRWWDFHEWAQTYLDAAGQWPMAGTQPWFDLPDTDPRKWAAVLSAAEHWALRMETCQQAQCQAAHAISAASDWPAIAIEIFGRHTGGRIPREVA